jgi:hypothetical protein
MQPFAKKRARPSLIFFESDLDKGLDNRRDAGCEKGLVAV